MSESPSSDDLLSTNLPEMAGSPASDQDGAPGESTLKSRFRQKKLLVVLSATALGGLLLGVAIMTVIAYLQPAAKAPPVIVAPAPDPKEEELDKALKELKAKNEKLEEQLKELSQSAPVSAPTVVSLPAPIASAVAPVAAPAPSPIIRPSRSSGAKSKEKVTADCTVPDKDEKLGDKLKSCIEGFNAGTN